MTAPELRPYQTAAIEGVREHFAKVGPSALVVMATGCGKTFTALSICAKVAAKGGRVLWLAHRGELLTQTAAAWDRTWPDLAPAGILQAGRNECDRFLVCASVQTLGRGVADPDGRLGQYLAHGAPSLVVVDEAHHSAAGQWSRILEAIEGAADGRPVFRLGLTATPERTDSASLVEHWGQRPAFCYSYADAIREDYLVEPVFEVDQIVLPPEAAEALSNAKTARDDRSDDRDELAQWARVAIAAGMVDHTVAAMVEHMKGRRSLVFCATVAQSADTVAQLVEAGFSAEMVSGKTPDGRRARIIERFAAGEIDALVNCSVLTEGTDLPRCDGIVAARPFSSRPLWIQAMGRGLRLHPEKTDCKILDLVGASVQHSAEYAGVIIDREQVDRGGAGNGTGRGGAALPGDPSRRRRPIRAQWVKLGKNERNGWAVDCGKAGIVILRPSGDGWRLSHIGRNGTRYAEPITIYDGPHVDQAKRLADDVFRRARGLVQPAAAWRTKPATDGQRRQAQRLGLFIPSGCNRGAASYALTSAKAKKLIARWSL